MWESTARSTNPVKRLFLLPLRRSALKFALFSADETPPETLARALRVQTRSLEQHPGLGERLGFVGHPIKIASDSEKCLTRSR